MRLSLPFAMHHRCPPAFEMVAQCYALGREKKQLEPYTAW